MIKALDNWAVPFSSRQSRRVLLDLNRIKIIFEDMIHYTTVKTTMFNGVNHPCIGIWNENSGFRLIKEFNYQDYKNRLS
jgi:hypothetical protein